jgi:hypothetical protein
MQAPFFYAAWRAGEASGLPAPTLATFDTRAARGICGRPDMLAQRQPLLPSVLDLALSYFAVISTILLAYPVLNKWLLDV